MPENYKKQKYSSIRSDCLKRGELFEDPEFPANNKSLFYSKIDNEIEWKRPKVLFFMFRFYQVTTPWGLLWFFHTYVGWILNFNIVWGMKVLWIFWGDHHKIRLYSAFYDLFLRPRYKMGDVLWGWYNFEYFWECLKFLICFGGEQ